MRVVDTLGAVHGPGCSACWSVMWIGRRGAGMAVSPMALMGAKELTIQVCRVGSEAMKYAQSGWKTASTGPSWGSVESLWCASRRRGRVSPDRYS